MTRINCVPPSELHDIHLIAEYRELPRVFKLADNWYKRGGDPEDLPKRYVLGTGHVRFFYDKLAWCVNRQELIIKEMERRGFKPKFTNLLKLEYGYHSSLYGDWTPTEDEFIESQKINRERIQKRMKNFS